mgnify:CR=1 FL=1
MVKECHLLSFLTHSSKDMIFIIFLNMKTAHCRSEDLISGEIWLLVQNLLDEKKVKAHMLSLVHSSLELTVQNLEKLRHDSWCGLIQKKLHPMHSTSFG